MSIEYLPTTDRINMPSKELVYNDGIVTKFDKTTCDTISFARWKEGRQIHLDSPAEHGGGKYIIATNSGNQYIVADGFIINTEKSKTYLMPDGMLPPDIKFGEPWKFGEGVQTSAVTAVAREVSMSLHDVPKVRVDATSPFDTVDKVLSIEAQKRDMRRGTLGASALSATERMPRDNRERLGLPRGFTTEKGSVYKYTPEAHTERWKFDGTHHAPMGIAVFVEGISENLEIITLDGAVDSHLPSERQFRSYVIEKTIGDDGRESARKVFDSQDVVNPDNIYYARVNANDKIGMMCPASIVPKVGYYVYEIRKEKDGKHTTRHPGHRVSEILH